MGSLTGKVALITGAGSGIGRGVARRYVAEGAKVAALDVVAEGVRSLAAEFGSDVLPITADVSQWDQNRDAVAATLSAFGKLDILVGNAGIYDHGVSLESMPGEDLSKGFDELFAVNVKGYILGVRAALDALLETSGCVILTASFASFHPSGGGVLYTSSKHAVAGLIRQLAYELAPDIRVNGVAPGIAPTTLKGIRVLGQTPKQSILDGTDRILPLQTVPDADAYGGLYALLASPREAGHMTGSIVEADSGLGIRGLARPSGRERG